MLGKNDLAKSTFTALSSTPKGDGELYYHKLPNDERGTTLLVAQLKTNKPVAEADTEAVKEAVGNNTTYKTMAQLIRFNCEANKFSTIKIEYYSEDRVMVRVLPFDVLKNPIWNDLVEKSPMELLRRISCSGD